jgi:hypothetical protein
MPRNHDIDDDAQHAIGEPGVRRLSRPVYARIITEPAKYEAFATIRVGDAATKRSVREVQTAARLLARGFRETDHTPVVVEEETGELIAFATIRRSHFPVERFYPEVDITAFGRDVAYKDVRLRDGRTTAGEIAVIAALDAIDVAFQGSSSPEVWARVLPSNAGSHAIFDRLQFLRIKGLTRPAQIAPGKLALVQEDQEVRIQHANKPLHWLFDREVYVPPENGAGWVLAPVDHANPPKRFAMGRNEPCICDSGLKWKQCCEQGAGGSRTTEEARSSGLVVVKDHAA